MYKKFGTAVSKMLHLSKQIHLSEHLSVGLCQCCSDNGGSTVLEFKSYIGIYGKLFKCFACMENGQNV